MQLGRSFITALPSEFATGLLTASVAFTYGHLGMASVGLAAVILLLYILRASVQSQERGEELTKRMRSSRRCRSVCSRRCCATLSMRDAMTARHSTAVALLPHGGRDARPRRARAGPDPHRRAAARHRQVHPRRFRPVRRAQAHRRRVGAIKSTPNRAPSSSSASTARARSPRSSCTTTSASAAAAIRPASRARTSRSARVHLRRRHVRRIAHRDSYGTRSLRGRAGRAAPRRRHPLHPPVVETFERMILERGVAFSHVDESDFEAELAFERRVAYARPRLTAVA